MDGGYLVDSSFFVQWMSRYIEGGDLCFQAVKIMNARVMMEVAVTGGSMDATTTLIVKMVAMKRIVNMAQVRKCLFCILKL